MATLTAIVLTHNEENNISECLDTCLFADEILVIDDFSNDNTVEIATSKSSKVRVLRRNLDGNWAAQRNFAINEAKGDWILFIDSDERVSEPLAQSIISSIRKGVASCYSFKRVNYFHDGPLKHGVFRPDWVVRLFPKNKGRYERRVHERLVSSIPTSQINGELLHYTYKTWDSYWNKFNKYTHLSSLSYLEQGKRPHFFLDIIVKPFWAFFKIYFLNLGFLDGKLGFVFSVNHALYTLTKYIRFMTLYNNKGVI